MFLKDYLIQNWALILVLLAFAISLRVTVFLDKKTMRRMYILILAVFLLSIVVFVEFYLAGLGQYREVRVVMMSIRYSATPVIIALVTFTLVKKQRWFVFIPAILLAILNFVSIFTGIVFSVDVDNVFHRGPLGYVPFIVAGLYCAFLIFILIHRSNKRPIEIIPILFLCFAFIGGLVLPFVFGSSYSHIFCTTIGIALFAYHEFSFLQLTKKDSLTGLLNRQAYYSETGHSPETITAILSIDMNGLKTINDTKGHAAGDEALTTLALCFKRSLRRRQTGYRIGGDEFIIVCWRESKSDVLELVERIRHSVAETPYTCSIGYCYRSDPSQTIDEMLKESDEKMYAEKELHYLQTKNNRRRN